MNILVIEDDERYSELIERYLDGLATQINVVHTWKDAEPFLAGNPDIVWIDLLMPGVDAEAALIRVAEVRRKNAETTILVVSGYPDVTIAERAQKAGADLFAPKDTALRRAQVIALIMLALLNAQKRGAETAEFLKRAQQFLAEQVKPLQSTILNP